MLELPYSDSKHDSIMAELQVSWIHNLASMFHNTLPLDAVRTFQVSGGTTSDPAHIGDYLELRRLSNAVTIATHHAHGPIAADALFSINKHLRAPALQPPTGPDTPEWRTTAYSRHLHLADDSGGQHNFSPPHQLPVLMDEIIGRLNDTPPTREPVHCLAQGLVIHNELARVQPFDGAEESRLPLLMANVPLLRAGYAPVILPADAVRHYLDTRDRMIHTVGSPSRSDQLWPDDYACPALESLFIKAAWHTTELLRTIVATLSTRQHTPHLGR